ncbi:type I toxin-antitoxin system toxin Ldr family protein [Shigella sonnei]
MTLAQFAMTFWHDLGMHSSLQTFQG